jgi:hypothetical protein
LIRLQFVSIVLLFHDAKRFSGGFTLEIALTREGGLIVVSLHKRVVATCSTTLIVVAFDPSMTPIDPRSYFQAITHSHRCCKQRMERKIEEQDAHRVKRESNGHFRHANQNFQSFLSLEHSSHGLRKGQCDPPMMSGVWARLVYQYL